jgi:hypothetical protein
MCHICVVMRATHDMRPAGHMFDMPDIEYVFFIQTVFLHLEIVYHSVLQTFFKWEPLLLVRMFYGPPYF